MSTGTRNEVSINYVHKIEPAGEVVLVFDQFTPVPACMQYIFQQYDGVSHIVSVHKCFCENMMFCNNTVVL